MVQNAIKQYQEMLGVRNLEKKLPELVNAGVSIEQR